MYYHASPTAGIRVLKPRTSNHNMPLVYFSRKPENTLVYLNNSIKQFCRNTGYAHTGKWTKWGPYGFQDGILQLQEYYPHALEETYRGISGYIYHAASIVEADLKLDIPYAAASSVPVPVDGAKLVPDAYKAILEAEHSGQILITRYGELSEKTLGWIRKTVQEQYEKAADQPEYRYFLQNKFDFIRRS